MNPFKQFAAAMILSMLPASYASVTRAETPSDTLVQAWAIDDIISLDPAEIFEFRVR
jgi:peptide/nickel transport system substrate-binding protein